MSESMDAPEYRRDTRIECLKNADQKGITMIDARSVLTGINVHLDDTILHSGLDLLLSRT